MNIDTFTPLESLNGKVAVVTGGAGLLGIAICNRLAARGAKIISIVRRNVDKAQELLDQLPNQDLGHKAYLASITDTPALKVAVAKIQDEDRKVDILVNNAGVSRWPQNIKDLDDAAFDEIIVTNIRGTFAVIREFSELLYASGDGLIVNIGSTAAHTGQHGCVAYSSSKAALEMITRTIARNMAPTVRCVTVSPGVLTHITSGSKPRPEGFYESMSATFPLKRIGTPDDIAATVEAIATTIRYATGVEFLIDGGRLA